MSAETRETQAAMTPEKARQRLVEGNERFRAGRRLERDLLAQVEGTRGGQWPFAAILSCIDSRVPPELVFDLGIGDVFSARIAGNFVNDDLLGSLEFACQVAGAKLIVVLGHRHCGAIKGACDGVELGHLTGMLAHLKPAVEATSGPADPAERSSSNAEFVQAVARTNVHRTVQAIPERSAVLAELLAAQQIDVVGALYDVETGAVEFLDAPAS